MPKKKPAIPAPDAGKEVLRVTFRFHGPELVKIREVREMLSLNTEVDAARYLMQRGLEVITATLTSYRVQGQMRQEVNATALIEQMAKIFGAAESAGGAPAQVQGGMEKK